MMGNISWAYSIYLLGHVRLDLSCVLMLCHAAVVGVKYPVSRAPIECALRCHTLSLRILIHCPRLRLNATGTAANGHRAYACSRAYLPKYEFSVIADTCSVYRGVIGHLHLISSRTANLDTPRGHV